MNKVGISVTFRGMLHVLKPSLKLFKVTILMIELQECKLRLRSDVNRTTMDCAFSCKKKE